MKRSQVILFVTAFALLVLASFSCADVITSDLTVKDADYSGKTLQFSSNTKQVGVTLTAVNVLTAPLYIAGKDSGASPTDAGAILSYVTGTLRQPVEFASLLPSNSILSFSNLYAMTPSKTSVFIFRSTSLLYNTTLNFYGITATWETRDAAASLVEANTVFSIQQRSAVYINNAVVSKSAHVFAAHLSSTLGITQYGVLAVDNSKCISCSNSLILIESLLYISDNSMFRASNDASGANPLIDHEGDVTIATNSLYYVSNITTSGGKLYAGPGSLTTSSNSVSTLSNITCGSTGYTSASPVAFTYVYLLTVNKVPMASAADCLANGVQVGADYFSADFKCTKAQCIPGTTISASYNPNTNKCVCNCQPGFNQLACTVTVDPLNTFVATTSSCNIANCKRCSSSRLGWCNECTCPYRLHDGVCTPSGTAEPNCLSLYDNGFCKKCASGYQLTDDYRCVSCKIANCATCYDNNLCSICSPGYTAGTNGVCYSTST